MAEAFKFLAANSFAAMAVSFTILLLGVTVAVMIVVAFLQGRALTFWPPAIGERPAAPKLAEVEGSNQPVLLPEGPTAPIQSSSDPVVRTGTILQGASGLSYTVGSSVYAGASATIYKVSNVSKRDLIAKVFWRGLAPNSGPWQLFQQEQRTAELLRHRNIVQTLDRGLRMGYPFIVMEFFGGGTLRDWIETHSRIPGRDILSIFYQLAEAVDYAHSIGVVHRDIKPGNILFEAGPNDRVALGDFGIAVVLGAVQQNLTAVGQEFSGSPGYLAPELLRGESATPMADIYSLGVVMYEMISARRPFDEHRETYRLMLAKLEKDAPDLRVFRPEISAAIAERIAQTLSRDKTLRPKSARAILSGIETDVAAL